MLDEVLEPVLVPRDVGEGRRLDEESNAARPGAPLGVRLLGLQQRRVRLLGLRHPARARAADPRAQRTARVERRLCSASAAHARAAAASIPPPPAPSALPGLPLPP